MPCFLIAAFTREGASLASRVAFLLGNDDVRVFVPDRYAAEGRKPLQGTVFDWTRRWFSQAAGLIFVSAAGIAVRAIGPHLKNKTTDPAVVVMDDAGKFVIPLLSGHIGGGNALAQKIALATGGQAVITTATDVHGIKAADQWAVENDCAIENVEAVKHVSAAMLEERAVGVAVTDALVSPPWPITLWLRPRLLTLGVGCKRGISAESFEAAVRDFLEGAGVSPLSLRSIASIELKRDEIAILDFCRAYDIPFQVFSAEDLRAIRGSFASSEKVLEVTGVDNVCERAAVRAGGETAVLLRSKTLYPGIALALARRGTL